MRCWTLTVEIQCDAEDHDSAVELVSKALGRLDDTDVVSYDITDIEADESREDAEDEEARAKSYELVAIATDGSERVITVFPREG